jgi:hypothetical protein
LYRVGLHPVFLAARLPFHTPHYQWIRRCNSSSCASRASTAKSLRTARSDTGRSIGSSVSASFNWRYSPRKRSRSNLSCAARSLSNSTKAPRASPRHGIETRGARRSPSPIIINKTLLKSLNRKSKTVSYEG